MADVFIDSAAVGLNDGTSKADAYTSILTTLTNWVSGDIHFISHAHSQSDARLVQTSTTDDDPFILISLDFATDLYREGVADQLYKATSDFQINIAMRGYGLYIRAGSDFWNLSACKHVQLFDGFFGYTHTSGNKLWYWDTGSMELNNVHLGLGSGAGTVDIQNNSKYKLCMRGGKVTGTTKSTGTFLLGTSPYPIDFDSVDLSNYLLTGKFIRTNIRSGNQPIDIVNCSVPAFNDSDIFADTNSPESSVRFINSNSAGTIDDIRIIFGDDRTIKSNRSIYLDAGFEQFDSGTKQSHAMVSIAKTSVYRPMYSFEIEGFIKTTGSKTFTVQLAHDFTAVLNSGDLILEILARGTSSTTLLNQKTSLPVVTNTLYDPQTPGSALATSVAAWVGAGSLTKQSVNVTLTINEIGHFTGRLLLRKYEASKTLYYNPVIDIT